MGEHYQQPVATIIRVWMRARTVYARAWEAAHAMPQLLGGARMGAQRAAWTIAFWAETAAIAAQYHAVALLDLVKAFEGAAPPLGHCSIL